ncbi:PepSY domain-containing protein [Streptomyces sp. NPDC006446]|uniref:PepSY domain-containing protein n=1 Tax=Streptomyces sp. NPDC006446 TaxID=3154301 RepID=UPI00339DF5D8
MKRNIVIATVAAATLIAGGTATALAVTGNDATAPAKRSSGQPGADDARDTTEAERTASPTATPTATATGTSAAGRTTLTAEAAVTRALAHTPGTAVGAELDDEHGAVIWEVEIIDPAGAWRDVRVDPATGKVLGSRTGHEDDAARVRTTLTGTSVSLAEAARTAAAKGTVTSIDVDDDGTHAWDVETLTPNGVEREWRIDLRTGRITPDHGSDDGSHDVSDDRTARGSDDRTASGSDDRAEHGSDDRAEHGSDDRAGHTSHHGAGHGSDDGSERGSDDD